MLDAGRAPAFHRGLSMFFDHADPGVVYVAPDVPRLVADPEPQLSLLLYRGPSGNGAMLQLKSILQPRPEQLESARSSLAAMGIFGRNGAPVVFGRPAWRAGTVKLFGFLQDRALAPRLLSITNPSLLGDPIVTISARLDADAAALAESALRGNVLPSVIAFELETLGLAGPLGVAVEADLRAIHERLTLGGALTTPYGAAKIKATWEELARENLIRIEVIDESGDIEGNRAEALRRVGEQLVAEMLTAEPPPEAPPQLDDRPVAPVELSFRLTMRREELSTTKRWTFRERAAVPVRYAASASLIQLLGTSDPAAFIRELELSTSRRSVLVRVEPELAILGLAALEVDVRVADREETEQSVLVTDASPEVELSVERDAFTPLSFRVRTRFDPLLTAAAERSVGWQRADGSVISISARRLFPPRTAAFAIARGEVDWLKAVEVWVNAPPEPSRMLVLDADHRVRELSLPGASDAAATYSVRWRGRLGEPSASIPPQSLHDPVTLLDSPFGDSMDVLCVPAPRGQITLISVELRSEHLDFVQTRTLVWEGDDRTPKIAELRRLHGTPRSYHWRETVVLEGGSTRVTEWMHSERSTLVLGGEALAVVACDVYALGGPAARGSIAVALALVTREHRREALLEGSTEHARLVLAFPNDAPSPTLSVDELMLDGSTRSTTIHPVETIIVLPPPL